MKYKLVILGHIDHFAKFPFITHHQGDMNIIHEIAERCQENGYIVFDGDQNFTQPLIPAYPPSIHYLIALNPAAYRGLGEPIEKAPPLGEIPQEIKDRLEKNKRTD